MSGTRVTLGEYVGWYREVAVFSIDTESLWTAKGPLKPANSGPIVVTDWECKQMMMAAAQIQQQQKQ
jgi:hypothetical protein